MGVIVRFVGIRWIYGGNRWTFAFTGSYNTPYEKIGDDVLPLDVPFDIPDTWAWARIKNFCLDIFSGKSTRYVKVPTEYRIVGQAANQQNGLDFNQLKYTDDGFWMEMEEKYFLQKNDVLLGCVSKVISRRNYASQSSVAAK